MFRSLLSKTLVLVPLIIASLASVAVAQNNLAAGDLAIASYQSDFDPTNTFTVGIPEFEDRFSLVVTRPGGIAAGTVIFFTTRGWNGPANTWHDEDYSPNTFGLGRRAVVQWTVPAGGLPAGREVFFINTFHDELPAGSEYYSWAAYNDQAGTSLMNNLVNVTPIVPGPNTTDGMGFSFSGDHMLVYQTGPTGGPSGGFNGTPIRFITAIHANINGTTVVNGTTSYASWDAVPGAMASSESSLPPGLTNGTTAFLMSPSTLPNVSNGTTEPDNGKFSNCALSLAGATSAVAMSTIIYSTNPAGTPTTPNWTYSNAVFPLGTSSGLCTYNIFVAPNVTTNTATPVGSTTATLNGTGNPNGFATTGYFRYSTVSPGTCNDTFGTRAPAAGGTALGSGSAGVAFNQANSSLTAGTVYFYCAIANNSGGTAFGAVQQFTTLATFTLTVTKSGTGNGTITSNPSGITCPGDCTEVYDAGTAVQLTATPTGGSTFTGWTGACSGTGACNVTMSAARSVTGTFVPPTAASVTISGRVFTIEGRGVKGGLVTIKDQAGAVRSVTTDQFGVYRIENVEPGQTYVITVRSRRFSFPAKIVTINDNLTDVDFVPE